MSNVMDGYERTESESASNIWCKCGWHIPRWAAVHTVMHPWTEQGAGSGVPVRSLARSLGNRFKS